MTTNDETEAPSMGKYWLKLIGTRERPCRDTYEYPFVTSRGKKRMRRIHPGDRMVLYAVGRGHRVFALAEVTSEAYGSGNPDWPHKVDIDYELRLPVSEGVPLDELITSERDLLRSLRQQAYIELLAEEYERIATRLREVESACGNAGPVAASS